MLSEKAKKLWPAGKLKKDHFLIMILMGILFLVIIWPAEKTSSPEESGLLDNYSDMMKLTKAGSDGTVELTYEEEALNELYAYPGYLEAKLEEALKMMDGAGKTKVMITLKASKETIVEKDAPTKRAGSTEVDALGGSRNTSDIETGQETIFYTNSAGLSVPYVRKTILPLIEGVLVVTEGGGDEIIIRNMKDAIKALFGVDEHKIKIVKMISSIPDK